MAFVNHREICWADNGLSLDMKVGVGLISIVGSDNRFGMELLNDVSEDLFTVVCGIATDNINV